MNYYEELGIAQWASTEEIRHAYKMLARLLHPDSHPDEDLRRLAEGQMKRLNMMLAVLTDPAQRRRYDLSLEPDCKGVTGPVDAVRPISGRGLGWQLWSKFATRPRAWIGLLCAALSAGAGIWYFSPSAGRGSLSRARPTGVSRREPETVPERKPLAAQEPAAPRLNRLAGELREARRAIEALRVERRAVLAQMARLRARKIEPAAPGMRVDAPPALVPSTAKFGGGLALPPGAHLAAPKPIGSGAHPFAGNWFYVPPAIQTGLQGVYPPEYIELRIAEESGLIRGRYRARYHVTDQAISSMVAFQFEGRAEGLAAHLPWIGAGGARGQVTLKVLSENAMEVKWSAQEWGDDLRLVSGAATLIRRAEP